MKLSKTLALAVVATLLSVCAAAAAPKAVRLDYMALGAQYSSGWPDGIDAPFTLEDVILESVSEEGVSPEFQENFKAALLKSFRNHGLSALQQEGNPQGPHLDVSVEIVGFEKSSKRGDVAVDFEAQYALVDKTGAEVCRIDVLSTRFTSLNPRQMVGAGAYLGAMIAGIAVGVLTQSPDAAGAIAETVLAQSQLAILPDVTDFVHTESEVLGSSGRAMRKIEALEGAARSNIFQLLYSLAEGLCEPVSEGVATVPESVATDVALAAPGALEPPKPALKSDGLSQMEQ